MILFHDISLPSFIAIHAKGGLTFDTNVIQTYDGHEIRICNRPTPIHYYTIDECCLNTNQFMEFYSFFCARKGMTYGFRLRDYSDYECVDAKLVYINDNKFQLNKIYSNNMSLYNRRITKPIKNTVKIKMDDKELGEDKYSIDFNSGIIDIPNSLISSEYITNFKFDVPVRFNTNKLKYSYQPDGNILIEDLPLVEII